MEKVSRDQALHRINYICILGSGITPLLFYQMDLWSLDSKAFVPKKNCCILASIQLFCSWIISLYVSPNSSLAKRFFSYNLDGCVSVLSTSSESWRKISLLWITSSCCERWDVKRMLDQLPTVRCHEWIVSATCELLNSRLKNVFRIVIRIDTEKKRKKKNVIVIRVRCSEKIFSNRRTIIWWQKNRFGLPIRNGLIVFVMSNFRIE